MANYPVQVQSFEVTGAGAVAGATTLTLSSFKDILGNNLTMSAFGDIGYGVIEPNTTNEDSITFTGITQNSNGTATLTGVNSIAFSIPFTSSTGLRVSHAGSVTFIITNSAAFYNNFANKNNIETITQNWSVPDPIGMTDIANKEYVLSVVNGGSVSVASVIVAGTADTTISAGQVVYLKSNGRWALADASTSSTVYGVQLGIAQGSGTSGNAITGGVLKVGIDTHQSGLVAGTSYYVPNGGGLPSTSAGTFSRLIGIGDTATSLYFDPNGAGLVLGQVSTTTKANSIPETGATGFLDEGFIQNIVSSGLDQSQTTSNSTITAGESNSTTGKHYLIAEKFVPTTPTISSVALWKIADSGTFAGTVKVSIQADSAGSPSGTDLVSLTITNAAWLKLTAAAEFRVTFATEYNSLTIGGTYWIVVTPSTNDNTNHINLGANSSGGYASGLLKYSNLVDGWTTISTSILYFKTYSGNIGKLVQTETSTGYPAVAVSPYRFIDLDTTSSSSGGTSETTVYSKELASNFLNATSGLRINVFFTIGGSGGTTNQVTFKAKYNGTAIATVTCPVIAGSSSPSAAYIPTMVTFINNNSQTSQKVIATQTPITTAAQGAATANSLILIPGIVFSTASADFTQPGLLEVTLTAPSSTSWSYSGAILEKIAA